MGNFRWNQSNSLHSGCPQRNQHSPAPHISSQGGRLRFVFPRTWRWPGRGLGTNVERNTHRADFSIKKPHDMAPAMLQGFSAQDLQLRPDFTTGSWRHQATGFLAKGLMQKSEGVSWPWLSWHARAILVPDHPEPSPSALESIILPKGDESLFKSISPSLLWDEDKTHNTWKGPKYHATADWYHLGVLFSKYFPHKRKKCSHPSLSLKQVMGPFMISRTSSVKWRVDLNQCWCPIPSSNDNCQKQSNIDNFTRLDTQTHTVHTPSQTLTHSINIYCLLHTKHSFRYWRHSREQ